MEHTLHYEKSRITVCGVTKVDYFEPDRAAIKLTDNYLNIKGSNFTMEEMSLSSGKITFTGTILNLTYQTKYEKSSFIKSLFK